VNGYKSGDAYRVGRVAVHWNNKRLPEQRAELHESVIGWLLDLRSMKRPDQIGRDECFDHIKSLSLDMPWL